MKKQGKFEIFSTIAIQSLTNRFARDMKINHEEANRIAYNSKLYKKIQNEEAKMWYFSSKDLSDMLKQEYKAGV